MSDDGAAPSTPLVAPPAGRRALVGAVVLAAGAGSRFAGATHKLLAPVRGRPVVAWAIEHAVAAGLDRTVVITGAADIAALVPDGIDVVVNDRWAEGQATSLQAARRWAEAAGLDAIVVGLGDQPFVPADAWRRVADADGALVTAVIDGARTPPVRIGRSLWADLPVEGDEGARVLMRGRPDLVQEVACPGHAADIDTVEDLRPWS